MTTPPPNPPTHPAHALLSRAHSPAAATTIFSTRIRSKPLILRPTSPPPSNNRERRRLERLRKKEYFRRKCKRKLGVLSAAEKRRAGVHDLLGKKGIIGGGGVGEGRREGDVRYEVYAGLNRLWRGYVWEVLGLTKPTPITATTTKSNAPGGAANKNKMDKEGTAKGRELLISGQHHGALLASLDFHGAELEVVRCGCVGRVGTKGVVIRDTKFTFVVVTQGNEVRTIPKKDTVFRFQVPLPEDDDPIQEKQEEKNNRANPTSEPKKQHSTTEETTTKNKTKKKPLTFELHGNQFQVRAADRANKKFKWKNMDYI